MSLPMTVWSWLKKQFNTHKVRSIAAVFLALALLVTGGLWAGGVFKGKETEENFTYLPNRTYKVADPDPPELETLYELLHADEPAVDTLLRNPGIAQELLQAEVRGRCCRLPAGAQQLALPGPAVVRAAGRNAGFARDDRYGRAESS